LRQEKSQAGSDFDPVSNVLPSEKKYEKGVTLGINGGTLL
jgi:hypothetical protein